MRKMDDILVNLFDFTPDLVTGLQMQLDSFYRCSPGGC